MKPQHLGFDEESTHFAPVKAVEPTPVVDMNKGSDNWFPVKGLPSRKNGYYARPLNYREIKKISYANESNIDDALLSVAKNAVQTSDNEPILDADLRYIFLWLRANSLLDPRFNMVFTCTNPDCGKDSSFKLEPSDIDRIELADGLLPSGESIKLSTGEVVVVSMPSAQRALDAVQITKLYAEDDSIELDAYIATFLNVGSLADNKPLTVFEWMEQQDPIDIIKIHEVVKKYDCGLLDVVKKPCEHCKQEAKIELDMSSVFFFPAV